MKNLQKLPNTINGKVLLISKDWTFYSYGLNIYKVNNLSLKKSLFYKCKCSLFYSFISKFDFFSRLFRLSVHHMISDGGSGYYIVFLNKVVRLDGAGREFNSPKVYSGSRPLSVCQKSGFLYFGQYFNNNFRVPVGIFNFDGNRINSIAYIDNIRHIHGVFYDKYSDSLFVTTGDTDKESGIWLFNLKTNKLDPFSVGGQQNRAVQLLFDESYIYYGTDTPLEQNFIYRINRVTKCRESLTQVSSSIFYGCTVNDVHFFSTAIEPSSFNTSRIVEVWYVLNGKARLLYSVKKDFLSMRYFQYGQIFFPNYIDVDLNTKLWLYKLSVKHSNTSIALNIKDKDLK